MQKKQGTQKMELRCWGPMDTTKQSEMFDQIMVVGEDGGGGG